MVGYYTVGWRGIIYETHMCDVAVYIRNYVHVLYDIIILLFIIRYYVLSITAASFIALHDARYRGTVGTRPYGVRPADHYASTIMASLAPSSAAHYICNSVS